MLHRHYNPSIHSMYTVPQSRSPLNPITCPQLIISTPKTHLTLLTIYNRLFPTTIAFPFAIHSTAPPTISSTISRALFFSLTTAAALPIRNGRALSIVSSSMSSPSLSKSLSTGMTPLSVSSLISAARFSSQFLM